MHAWTASHIPTTTRRAVLTKLASFEESKFHFSQNTSSGINNYIGVNPSAVNANTETIDDKSNLENRQRPPSFVTFSDEKNSTQEGEKLDEEGMHQTTPGHQVPRRNSPHIRKPPKTFGISALLQSHTEDVPSVKQALGGTDKVKWSEAVQGEMQTLQKMNVGASWNVQSVNA